MQNGHAALVKYFEKSLTNVGMRHMLGLLVIGTKHTIGDKMKEIKNMDVLTILGMIKEGKITHRQVETELERACRWSALDWIDDRLYAKETVAPFDGVSI